MAGRIRQDDIEAVKERTDLVKLVGQYLTLKKTGHDSMSGLCPFHQEKTPQLQRLAREAGLLLLRLRQGRGRHHVPARAGAPQLRRGGRAPRAAGGGDPALRRRLAVGAPRRPAARRLDRGERARRRACSRRRSPTRAEAEEARTYLAGRGIGPEAVQAFGIGYAPRSRDYLLRQLSKARDLSPEVLLEAGLASRGDDGGDARPLPRRASRSRSTTSRAAGSGSARASSPRTHALKEQPKYLNTAETPHLPQERGPLQPAPRADRPSPRRARSSWWRATRTSSRSRRPGSRTRWPRAARRWARRTSGCCRGSRSAPCCRSTRTRPGRAPPSVRTPSRSSTRCRRWS